MATNASGGEPVLELRIHGVNNMPPHELLDLPPDEVEFAMGDKLGSFWHPTAESLEKGRALQELGEGSRGVVDAVESPRGSVPDGIHREAYSWGGMVRTVPPGTGAGGAIIAAVGRACWTAVLPFSIANAAIWSWNLPRTGTRIRFQSGLIRVFCVVLTTLLILSFASVALDLIAVQCYGGRQLTCTALPEQFEMFAGWSTGRRIAFFSIVPVAVLFAVFATSTLARLRYNVAGRIIKGAPSTDEPVLLAQPRFWQTRTEISRLTSMHLATGIAMTALLCGLALLSGSQPGWGIGVCIAATIVMVTAVVLAYRTDTMPFERLEERSPLPTLTLTAAFLVLAVATGALSVLPGLDINGYTMRIAFNWVLVSTVLLAVLLVTATLFFPAPDRRHRAWGGMAPAVFMTMGLVIGLALSSVVNVVVGDWLNGDKPPSALGGGRRLAAAYASCTGTGCVRGDPSLRLGAFYPWYLGVLLAFLIVAVLIVAIALIRRRDVLPRIDAFWDDASKEPPIADGSPRGDLRALLAGEVRRKRAAAARYHLVEPILGALCLAGMAATVVTVITAFSSLNQTFVKALLTPEPFSTASVLAARWMDFSLIVWGAVGLAVVGGLVFGGSKVVRPLGLVWDLACFLPRAGHPLGAPCYTERAVPEVARRLSWWLDLPPVKGQERTAIVTAHSMGGVVAVSSLFALATHPNWLSRYQGRVSLLTFGIQLRPYFGRFWPEILGPEVIGGEPCRAPKLRARDPWASDRAHVIDEQERAAAAGLASERPAPGVVPVADWISLWRATDFLGFPSWSTTPNDRDVYAEEVDASGYVGAVDAHSWYPRTPSYRRALGRLAGLPERQPGRP